MAREENSTLFDAEFDLIARVRRRFNGSLTKTKLQDHNGRSRFVYVRAGFINSNGL